MGELLPEFWASPRDTDGDPSRERRTRQAWKVRHFHRDPVLWHFVAVIAPGKPRTMPELMVYIGTIVRVLQDYEGLGWVRYDSAFRRQAALSGS